MKPMRCILLFVIALLMSAVVSCGSSSDRASLVALDSLILQDPDSACELLATYPADSLTNDDDRAYHALLTTIADYKAYRPATTDSVINIAVNHYDHDAANPDHRMRSLLYKGCVMEELGNPEQAIEYYKRAETLCPTDDYFNKGYINLREALLYQSAYVDSISFMYYDKAIDAFRKAKNKRFEAKSLNSKGLLYSLSNTDSALLYLKCSITLAQDIKDSLTLYSSYNSLCTIYFEKEEYGKVTDLANKGHIPKPNENNRIIYDIISISYSKQGNTSVAKEFFEKAPVAKSVNDSISQFRAMSELDLSSGNYSKYVIHNAVAVDMADSLLMYNNAEKIREAEAKYDLAMQEVKHLSRQKKMTIIISVLVLFAITTSIIMYFQRKRISLAKIENEEAQSQLSALKNQLDIIAQESLKRVTELREQALKLRNQQNIITTLELEKNKQFDSDNREDQLRQTNETLKAAEVAILIQNKTRFCLDEILRLSFYSGRYNSDQVIDNDSPLVLSSEFWESIFEIVLLKHDNLFEKIAQKGIVLTTNEKKLLSLCSINIPGAITRRILNYKNIQVVSNQKRKLAKKITSYNTRIEDIFG